MDDLLTHHGEERMRKRLGLPRKAVARTAEKALREGYTHSQFSGSFKRYLDGVYLKERTANNLRVYGGHLYLFAGETLVTCWQVPNKFRNAKPHV